MKRWMLGVLLLIVAGCADFEKPSKNLTIESMVGGGPSLVVGMTQDDVLEKWGQPNERKVVGETQWGAPIEQWTYHGWLPEFPVDYRYVSKGRNLFFEGNALARWEEIKVKKEE